MAKKARWKPNITGDKERAIAQIEKEREKLIEEYLPHLIAARNLNN